MPSFSRGKAFPSAKPRLCLPLRLGDTPKTLNASKKKALLLCRIRSASFVNILYL